MKKSIVRVAAGLALLSLAACGQHNEAPSKGVNLDSERIYGESRGAAPKQIKEKPLDRPSTEALERISNIKEILYAGN
ncbi:hypothetical protein [Algivirga pacifica]|uniref:Lipoprotein n=1 Tax=Algivirga pacifica TaxID=1162670 RepID=A0ABP9D5G5_9BACT